MQMLNYEIKNARPVLTDLIGVISGFSDPENVYLHGKGPVRTSQTDADSKSYRLGIREAALPEFLTRLGIRSITVKDAYENTLIPDFPILSGDYTNKSRWSDIKSEQIISNLKDFFKNCKTVAFDDWSSVSGASDLWNGLLQDVIRPLKKMDLDFIFYLGDSSKRSSFLVDEMLDVMGDFSLYGRVTFCLDENEAINLWMVLNGEHPGTKLNNYRAGDLKRKYLSIYRTMNIAHLLIYSLNDVMLLSNKKQFVFARRIVESRKEIASDSRDNFVTGLSIGFLLKLEPQHCIALGLIVFGAIGEEGESGDQEALLSYLHTWINDIDKPETIHLYE